MKKLTVFLTALLLAICTAFGLSACGKPSGEALQVYVPDGAPALSLARTMSDSEARDKFSIHVVNAGTIATFIGGETPAADVCIMPVNAAVKAIAGGAEYKMLGTVTHGNLFLLKHEGGEDVSLSTLDSLKGKTVGVINLVNVPGLTFKAILKANDLEFNVLADGAEAVGDKVNLRAIANDKASTEVTPAKKEYDYFVVPEPAASTKVSVTKGKLAFACEGGLQSLYGGENGYPQAVIVVKNSVLETRRADVDDLLNRFAADYEWLISEETSAETILNNIKANYLKADTAPAFTAANLTKAVIKNCGIKFVKSADCKQEVIDYMAKVNAVAAASFGTPTDDFFA